MVKSPIGIFDSGVGGLTVFKEIRRRFPQEDLIYFGDTARVPYGPKSAPTVVEYSVQNARFLLQAGAKIIVIACNTSSALALDYLSSVLSVPVIGVIEPGAAAAVHTTVNRKIGVIGTEGTINSRAYHRAISKLDEQITVIGKACPLFVPLVEEGWEDHPAADLIISTYLTELVDSGIDTLVLGCTHYPILKNRITRFLGTGIRLIDSAESIACQLDEQILPSTDNSPGENSFFVSDNEKKFSEIASRILGTEIFELRRVKLGESWYLE